MNFRERRRLEVFCMKCLKGSLWEDLRAMVGRFAEVCRRRGLKVNAGKSKVMIMNGEERLE